MFFGNTRYEEFIYNSRNCIILLPDIQVTLSIPQNISIISKLPILLNLCLFGNTPNTLKVCKLHYDNKNSHLSREGGEAVKEKWQREE